MRRPRILTLVDYYLPGSLAGGPLRTIAGMVERLSDEFDFWIVTRDRDFGDPKPYEDLAAGTWQPVGRAHVNYLPPGRRSAGALRSLIGETDHDALYLNSLFSSQFTLKPLLLRRLGLLADRPVVVAPRGELSPGALRLKWPKKRAFIPVARGVGLYAGVLWHASSEYERADIYRWFPGSRVVVAGNLNGDSWRPEDAARSQDQVMVAPDMAVHAARTDRAGGTPTKTPGSVRLVFLSRLSRKKNLDGALRMLRGVRSEVQFDIYGPVEDERYWRECQAIIADLPPNVRVDYRGPLRHEQVLARLSGYDALFLPTLGENYGHVILEALLAGLPVLISDQTPWRDLQSKGVGWDLPLDTPEAFQHAIDEMGAMDETELTEWSGRARAFGSQAADDPEAELMNRRLLRRAVAGAEAGEPASAGAGAELAQ